MSLCAPAHWHRVPSVEIPTYWRSTEPVGTLALAITATIEPGFKPRLALWRTTPAEARAFALDVARYGANHHVVQRADTLLGCPSVAITATLEAPHDVFTLWGFEVATRGNTAWRLEWGTMTGSESWPAHRPAEKQILREIDGIRRSLRATG